MELASYHQNDDAQIWFDMMQAQEGTRSWMRLKEALNLQFGPSEYEDFYGDLTRLVQDSSVKDYTVKFNRLLARVGHITTK